MPGIREICSNHNPYKLIIAEEPGGRVMLTIVDVISHSRMSIGLSRHAAEQAEYAIRVASGRLRS